MPDCLQEHRGPDFLHRPGITDLTQNLQTKGNGMPCAAACDDTSAFHGWRRHKRGSLGLETALESVETGELHAAEIVKLSQNETRRGANRSDSASLGIMLLHRPYQSVASGKIPGTGHSPGEYHYIGTAGTLRISIQIFKKAIRTYCHSVRRSHKRLITNRNKPDRDPPATQNVVYSKGLDILETVCKKYIDTFHAGNIEIISRIFRNFADMEEEKKLYPLRLCPIVDEYGWGREEFKLADLGYKDSMIAEGWLGGNTIGELMDMYMDRVTGEDAFANYGRQFPFELKYLHVKGKMPLRVHPDDVTAAQRYDFLGKEKLWYIVRAGSDARILAGFSKDTDASEVYGKCLDGSIADILNAVAPKVGECYHIAPGTPHAACGDLLIAEVSESSPLDFCMCGWGEQVSAEEFDESLGLVDALDFINYGRTAVEKSSAGFPGGIRQFSSRITKLDDAVRMGSERSDSPVALVCLEGEASVRVEIEGIGTASHPVKEGQTLLIPAELPEFTIVPVRMGTTLLETGVENYTEPDAYINPDVPAELDDDEESSELFS